MSASITIIGTLGSDAKAVNLGGTDAVKWSVASNTKGRNGNADHAAWFDVIIWKGWDSQLAAKSGDPVVVVGELTTGARQDGGMFLNVSAQPWMCQCPRREQAGGNQRGGTQRGNGGGWGGRSGGSDDGW